MVAEDQTDSTGATRSSRSPRCTGTRGLACADVKWTADDSHLDFDGGYRCMGQAKWQSWPRSSDHELSLEGEQRLVEHVGLERPDPERVGEVLQALEVVVEAAPPGIEDR